MITLTFVTPAGKKIAVQATAGDSVMMAAVTHGIDGIVADCGGAMACATCHVYVDPTSLPLLKAVGAEEDGMLDGTASERRGTSRLSCQLIVTDGFDRMEFRIPEVQ